MITASQFVLQLDFSIVNVALPTLAQELHLNPARLQWMVTGYALTFGSLLLLGGRIGDRFGHRRILLLGLILFGVTSLGAGLAQNAPELIFARFAQGASAALVAPQALASLTDLYRDGPGRSQALGIFQGASAAGASAGIVLGGLLTEYVGWRAVFLVNPPIIVAMVVVMHRVLPSVPSVDRNRLDVLGATVSTASLASLIYGLSEGQQQGFTAPAALCALVASALLAVTFVIVERRQSHPILPFQIFADPARRAALTVMLLMGGVVAGYVYFASLYLQGVLRFSAVLTGVALIPATAIVLLTSVLLTPKLLARHSVKT